MNSYRLDQIPCLEWLAMWPDSSVDAVLTDPAYESLDRHRSRGSTTRLTGGKGANGIENQAEGFFKTIPNAMYFDLALEFARILKPHGALILFGDDETQDHVAIPALVNAGWKYKGSGSATYQRTVIWDKMRIGMGYHVRRQHERIIVWQRPKVRSHRDMVDYYGGYASIQRCQSVRGGYPTEKPVKLLSGLIRQFTNPGELVIDCFLGSGSTGEAALVNDRDFAGCDISERSIQISCKRLTPLGIDGLQIPRPSGQLGLRI